MSSGKMFNQSGLKKLARQDPTKAVILKVPPHLIGAIFVYGRIKSGKTTSILSLAGLYHDNPNRKYKICDFWGGDRDEHLYWTLPSDQQTYWKSAQKMLRLDKPGPKQYKVHLWYPITKKIRKKLPFLSEHIISKMFTIPIRELLPADASLVVGKLSENSEAIWKNVIFDSKPSNSVHEIIKKYRKSVQKTNTLYNGVLLPLSKNLLLQDDKCIYNLDRKTISKELDDQESIFVLCLDFVDKEHRLLIAGYVMRLIGEELDRKKRKVIGIMREASDFFKVTDRSIVPDRYKVMKSYLSQWIRMGRRGFHLLLDTQSPNETRGIVDGQQDLTLLGRLPADSDRVIATERLFKDGFITQKQITKLASSMPGEFCFCPSGREASFNYILLPKSDFWKEKYGNFYTSVWAQKVDKWTSFSEEINQLKQKYRIEKEEADKKDKRDSIQQDTQEMTEVEVIKVKKDSPVSSQLTQEEAFANYV